MSNAVPIASLHIRHKVIDNCWEWLNSNFSKLTEQNKIKVVLAICGKNVPQEVISNARDMNVVIVKNGEPVGNTPQTISRPLPVQQ
jgi:hypothetical protein